MPPFAASTFAILKRLAAVALVAAGAMSVCAAEAPAWVSESNRNAEVLLAVMAQFNPEDAAELGVEGYDGASIDLGKNVYERNRKALHAVVAELQSRRSASQDAAVRQDLDILVASAQQSLQSARLQHELLLPYFSVARITFNGMRALLDPRVPVARHAAALLRLRRYAGMEPGSRPLTELAMARTTERLGVRGLVGPYRGEVEQDLADTARLADDIGQLLAKSSLSGYDEALSRLRQQLEDYDEWLITTVMPIARNDHRLPAAIYADRLRQVGVDIEPDELVRRALLSFAEIRNEMQALAPLVARDRGYANADYRAVIRELKKQQLAGDAVLPLYRETLSTIEASLRREHVVTLPQREAQIRLASEAESAMIPAPFMSPPRLIGNTGEYGEFVLPLKVPGRGDQRDLVADDFTYRASAWTLTAHEARPGHELQFAAMLEKGVSTARAIFAFNSVNVEGWALYAEAEMKPTFPLDGQLIGLQLRLMRAARAFLDPMVNLGRMTPEQVNAFLQQEVVLSPGMAKSETDRYVFRMPGQAAAYFHGYQALLSLRQQTELALGERFDRQRFHDFVLAQGLLPSNLLERAVLDEFVLAELKGH